MPVITDQASNALTTNTRPFGLGGSDIGSLLGLSPYKTPLQLWAEKVSLNSGSSKDAIHLRFGHHVEPFIAQEYERQTGLRTVTHAPTIYHPEHGFMYLISNMNRPQVANGESVEHWNHGAQDKAP